MAHYNSVFSLSMGCVDLQTLVFIICYVWNDRLQHKAWVLTYAYGIHYALNVGI